MGILAQAILAQAESLVNCDRLSTTFAFAMKTLQQEEILKVPKGIKIEVKAKKVKVTGKHGSLERDFKHLPIELYLGNSGKEVRVRMYFAKSKQLSSLQSCCSHISNLFDGVEKKFHYTMRLVYSHFPINATITKGGKCIELRNYLGEKRVRIIDMLPGVIVEKSAGTKDEIQLTGTDIDLTSRSAALVRQSCLSKNKDIRKFLDGVYVSSHGVIEE